MIKRPIALDKSLARVVSIKLRKTSRKFVGDCNIGESTSYFKFSRTILHRNFSPLSSLRPRSQRQNSEAWSCCSWFLFNPLLGNYQLMKLNNGTLISIAIHPYFFTVTLFKIQADWEVESNRNNPCNGRHVFKVGISCSMPQFSVTPLYLLQFYPTELAQEFR